MQRGKTSGSGARRLSGAGFEAWLSSWRSPVLVLFDAPWSAACRLVVDDIAAVASHFEGRIRVGGIDATARRDVARRYGIDWVPTLVLLLAGRVIGRWEGARSLSDLIRDIEITLTNETGRERSRGLPHTPRHGSGGAI